MTYRNESEALRARVDQLEDDLASAEERIAKLSGEKTDDAVQREVRESRLTGASSGVTLSETLPYELTTEGYEAIATLVRERLKVQVSQVGHSLTTPGDVFSLRREDGRTTLRLHGDWGILAGGMISAGALTTLFGGGATIGVLHDVGMHHPVVSGLHALWIVPTLVTGAVWLARGRARTLAKANLALYQGTLEAVRALAEKHAVKRDPVRARVLAESALDEEQEADGSSAHAAKSSASPS